MTLRASIISQEPPKTFNVNRPAYYAIARGNILVFTGKLAAPETA